MNIVEMFDVCKKIFEEHIQSDENWAGFEYIGLHFDDKELTVGEICKKNSKNSDGVSSFNLADERTYDLSLYKNQDIDCSELFSTKNCYVVAGNKLSCTSPSPVELNEIVIKGALVLAKIF